MATNSQPQKGVSNGQTTLNTYAQFAAERAAEHTEICENGMKDCPGSDGLHFDNGAEFPESDNGFPCFEHFMEAFRNSEERA
jgi:hypothetical protein